MPMNFLPEQKQEAASKNVWNNVAILETTGYILGTHSADGLDTWSMFKGVTVDEAQEYREPCAYK